MSIVGVRRVTIADVEVEVVSEARARRPALEGGARMRWTLKWQRVPTNVYRDVRLFPSHAFDDLESFFDKVRPQLLNVLRAELANGPIKAKCTIEVDVMRGSDSESSPKQLTSGAFNEAKDTLLPLVRDADVAPAVDAMLDELRLRFDGFEEGGSGWRFVDANWLELRLVDFVPLRRSPRLGVPARAPRGFLGPRPRAVAAAAPPAARGARRGASYIPTPPWLVNKKCVVNVRNDDGRCLEYALLSAVRARDVAGHRERPEAYARFLGMLKMDGVCIPASVEDAASVSEMNDLPLHVLGLDVTDPANTDFTLEHHNRVHNARAPIVLLRLHRGAASGHFVWVRRFNAFVRSSRTSLHCCARCLQRFKRKSAYDNHVGKACVAFEAKASKLPPKNKSDVYFTGIAKTLPVPFVVYADIESILAPADEARGAKTTAYQVHVPWFVGARLVSRYPEALASRYVGFVGSDCIDQFLQWLFDVEAKALRVVSSNKPMELTPEQAATGQAQTECRICGEDMGADRVHDHDHISGAFRGIAHKACNLALNYGNFKLPVFFHNLANYDAHFILQRAGAYDKKMTCLAKTMEKFTSFSIGRCVFKDSMQFLGKALGTCVESLTSADFALHSAEFAGVNSDLRALLLQKGVMPFDWLDCADKLAVAELPPQSAFYSQLSKTACSDEDYQRARRVWELSGCATMRDYVSLYLKTDVVLLADVFEAFRAAGFGHYGLDAAHYYTLPGFSWDAFLKQTGAVIGCIYDGQQDSHEMLDMLRRGMRGGVSVVSTRHAVANNPYLNDYDPTKVSLYIMNWDANNLYGGAMCEALPSGGYSLERIVDAAAVVHDEVLGYEDVGDGDDGDAGSSDCSDRSDDSLAAASCGWSECDDNTYEEEGDAVDERDALVIPAPRTSAACAAEILKLDDHGPRGCFVEVDLEIPRELHDALNDYPPAPESTLFEPSPLMATLRADLNLPPSKVHKLIPNLRNKTAYVVHYRALKAYVKLGCVVTKVHKALWFAQAAYMAPYIQYNTQRRADAKTPLERDMLKLMNNAIFGKTCENVEGRMNVLLKTDGAKIAQYAAKPTFIDMHLIGGGLVAIHMRATSVLYNKPLAVGVAVLDISKTFMYAFHYGHVRRRYGDKARLLFTDTDSLTYLIETPDVYRDMVEDLAHFDTSDYPRGHFCRSDANKKVVLKMKDESNGVPIRAFAGLRAKMYCFLKADGGADATAKGIARSEIARLEWANYEAALFGTTADERKQEVSFSAIRSSRHQVCTLRLRKTGLCAYDDKRHVLDDNVRTLAHGHWRIEGLKDVSAKGTRSADRAEIAEVEAGSDEADAVGRLDKA